MPTAHGRALGAVLALEEAGDGGRHRQRAGRLADDQDRPGAERRALRAERLGVERHVEIGRAEGHPGGAAGEHEADRLGRAPRVLVDHPPQGRAQGHLVDARPTHVAPDRDQRRLAASIRLGVGQGRGDARERLHVLHERGPAPKPDGGRQRRLGPRPGLAALQRLEHRRLLAGDVAVVAPADLDRQAVQRSRGDRARERFRGPVERALQEDDRLARPDRPGGEREAGDHVGRPPQHDEPVLVGAGLALGAVGDHEGLAALDAHRPPLAGRLEPAPAPATEAGGGQPLEEGVGVSAWRVFVAKGARLLRGGPL